MAGTFTAEVVRIIQSIPYGRVCTYGQIAAMAGSPRGARQVVRILHTKSGTEGLPWHRVINSRGKISLYPGEGYEEQRVLLESEGVVFDQNGRVDFGLYLWEPELI